MSYLLAYLESFLVYMIFIGFIYLVGSLFVNTNAVNLYCLYVAVVGAFSGPVHLAITHKESK